MGGLVYKLLKPTALGLCGILLFSMGVWIYFYLSVPVEMDKLVDHPNLIIQDRYGRDLRFYPDVNEERHLWIDIDEVPVRLIHAFLAAEDARFYSHSGFDILSIARAVKTNLFTGRTVSGASTITQQTVKLIYPSRRTYSNKVKELIRSIKLEKRLSKEAILEQYLNRLYLGNNIRGIKLAANVYFGKKCDQLNYAECAVLAALPKAPGYLNPYGNNVSKLLNRKNWILFRMHKLGYISGQDYIAAKKCTIHFQRKIFQTIAPHFLEMATRELTGRTGMVKSTLDLDVQLAIESRMRSHQTQLNEKGVRQAAVIVIHNPTMGILGLAGSFRYGNRHQGYNNGAMAFRSPGSTLKPFAYALALDKGYNTSLLLSDIERTYASPGGDFLPANFDRNAYGPVTMRTALGNSLNLSAIRLLNMIGYEDFFQFLDAINLINYPEYGPHYYGLGLIVGNPEISLKQLATAYAMLANKGCYHETVYLLDQSSGSGFWALTPESAFIITDILSDPTARVLTFGSNDRFAFSFPVAFKTGTSTHYRDCWMIGYTSDYTVGVWAGNFDGSPTNYQSGATAAGLIFRDIMQFLHTNSLPEPFRKPEKVIELRVCAYSGMRPTPNCPHHKKELFISGSEPVKPCTFHIIKKHRHYLDTRYTAWLFEKKLEDTAGSYLLQGFDDDLDAVFNLPSNPAINASHQSDVRVIGNKPANIDVEQSSRTLALNDTVITIGKSVFQPEESGFNISNKLEITSPRQGNRIIKNSASVELVVKLGVVSAQPVDRITWYIDGTEYARVAPPYQIYWPMERGEHDITAVDPYNNADSVTILVE